MEPVTLFWIAVLIALFETDALLIGAFLLLFAGAGQLSLILFVVWFLFA